MKGKTLWWVTVLLMVRPVFGQELRAPAWALDCTIAEIRQFPKETNA